MHIRQTPTRSYPTQTFPCLHVRIDVRHPLHIHKHCHPNPCCILLLSVCPYLGIHQCVGKPGQGSQPAVRVMPLLPKAAMPQLLRKAEGPAVALQTGAILLQNAAAASYIGRCSARPQVHSNLAPIAAPHAAPRVQG